MTGEAGYAPDPENRTPEQEAKALFDFFGITNDYPTYLKALRWALVAWQNTGAEEARHADNSDQARG